MSGYIEERGNNTFRLVVSCGFDAKGRRIKHTRTFHGDKRSAKRALAEYVVEIDGGNVGPNSGMLLRDWAETWIVHQEKRLAARTVASYRSHLQNRILPALGHIPLNRLSPRHINEFLAQLEGEGVRLDGRGSSISGATRLRHLRTLAVMLQEAVYRQHISRNPTRGVRSPRILRQEARYYEQQDIKRLMEALQQEAMVFRAMVYLAVLVGLRRGEIIALEWDAVDFGKRSLTIRQSVQILAKSGQSLKTPKAAASMRTIAMPILLIETLQEWQKEQLVLKNQLGATWRGTRNFVCTDMNGAWLSADQLTRDFKRFVERHNLPVITVHGLRHTAASLLIANGLPVRTVSTVLGHSQASTTLNIYCHTFKSSLQDAADVIDSCLAPTVQG